MRACRTASVFAMTALLGSSALASCREAAPIEAPAAATAQATAPAAPTASSRPSAEPEAATAPVREVPATAAFVDVPGKVDAPICSQLFIAVAKGKVTALGETLGPGDVLAINYPDPVELQGSGLVVAAHIELAAARCTVKARPTLVKKVVRATAAPELKWASGTMSAHLDVAPNTKGEGGNPLSPDLYLGRLEGTAAVAEHDHPGSWEILAAVDASGTFVISGVERPLAARQIVMVPPGIPHAWKPTSGSRLVAVQLYVPPGPEQRFVGLAKGDRPVEKDGGVILRSR